MDPRASSIPWSPVKIGCLCVKKGSERMFVPPKARIVLFLSAVVDTKDPKQDRFNPEVRRDPNNVETDCAEQIWKLEQAIEILGKDSPQSVRLMSQLKRLQVACTPIGERLDACQRFVERARTRHAATEEAVKKAVEIQSKFETELQEGLERSKRLREDAAATYMSSMRVNLNFSTMATLGRKT